MSLLLDPRRETLSISQNQDRSLPLNTSQQTNHTGLEKVTSHVLLQLQPPNILSCLGLKALRTVNYLKRYTHAILCLSNAKLIR